MKNENQASFSQAVNENRTSLSLFVPREMWRSCFEPCTDTDTHTDTETHGYTDTTAPTNPSTQTSTTLLKSCGISLAPTLPPPESSQVESRKKVLEMLPESPRRPFPGKLASGVPPWAPKDSSPNMSTNKAIPWGKLTTSRLPFP